ncbi:type VII secretion system-associated protein [Saccharopolyspora sp. CA-218241]|uniref:type VII secretion system-associated protein n=1 Tax=Saccharopolyspora sp. CA-218241 TaxID=3240027 RepID=UPI003D9823C7
MDRQADQRRLLRAWEEITARPALLPLTWFQHVDEVDRNAAAREAFRPGGAPAGPAPREQWDRTRWGRALGLLVGGAVGDALGSLGPAPPPELLDAVRARRGAWMGAGEGFGAVLAAARSAVGGEAPTAGALVAAVPVALAGAGLPEEVFRRALAAARPWGEDAASSAVLAVALASALADGGTNLARLTRALLAEEHVDGGLRDRLDALAEIGRRWDAWSLDDALARLGDGTSRAEVVTRALLLAHRVPNGGRAVLHAASLGGPDALICGLLAGARAGSGTFPHLWRRALARGADVEAVAADLFAAFGPDGPRPAEPVPSAPEPEQGTQGAAPQPEGDVSQPQGTAKTALEQAIERCVAEGGPLDEVYREFLAAPLHVLCGPGSTSPALFQVPDRSREQIWVCTQEDSAPDLGAGEGMTPGMARANGYELLPTLAERDVLVITPSGMSDIVLVGATALRHALPELDDGLRASATPASWLPVPDRMYRGGARTDVPGYAVVGEFWVDESGVVTDRYRPNPDYRPSPATLGFPQPENELEKILHLWATGHASDRSMLLAVAQSEVVFLAHEDGVPAALPFGGKSALAAGSSAKYVPDSEPKVGAAVAQLKRAFEDVDLVIDVGTRHQADIGGRCSCGPSTSSRPKKPGRPALRPSPLRSSPHRPSRRRMRMSGSSGRWWPGRWGMPSATPWSSTTSG